MIVRFLVLFFTLMFVTVLGVGNAKFVSVKGGSFYVGGMPYYFVGTNYWYGGLLGLETDKRRGLRRLRRELDFLKANGVTNLRLMAGAEGSGPLNGVIRVGPPLQPAQGEFDQRVMEGLDLVLYEMGRREMKAVIFLSNNWEWSGGFQQYLLWNGRISNEWLSKKPDWDALRDIVSGFYSCGACVRDYLKQVEFVLNRVNKFNRRRYIDDPTIMAWELANEPRPMRPAANEAYLRWIGDTAAFIRHRDPRHLITTGHEGWIGTADVGLFRSAHMVKDIDYITIHIWPKNWGWFREGKLAEDHRAVLEKASAYIKENAAVAAALGKPIVIEEFGLPRDGVSFDPASKTTLRDGFYRHILSFVGDEPARGRFIAGANFWAFGGSVEPVKGQLFWRPGDEYIGDPPMEEQGLNSVFAFDASTWRVIRSAARTVPRAGSTRERRAVK